MSKQTNIKNFLNKPAKNTGYLAQLKEELVTQKPTVSPVQEKKRKLTSPIIASPPITKKQKKTEESAKKVQTCLDLGQSDFQKKCPECGMFYSPGNEEDEKIHKKFHLEKSKAQQLSLKGIGTLKVVKEWIDGVVYVVSSDDKANFAKKCVQEIRTHVNQQLSYSHSKNHIPQDEKTYIYVHAKKLAGCLIVESISHLEAFPIVPNEEMSEHDALVTQIDRTKPTQCKLGVSRIWVSESLRRQGLASRLMSAMLADAVYGEVVPRTLVAFSQPTADGKQFGAHFFGTNSYNIYTP